MRLSIEKLTINKFKVRNYESTETKPSNIIVKEKKRQKKKKLVSLKRSNRPINSLVYEASAKICWI